MHKTQAERSEAFCYRRSGSKGTVLKAQNPGGVPVPKEIGEGKNPGDLISAGLLHSKKIVLNKTNESDGIDGIVQSLLNLKKPDSM